MKKLSIVLIFLFLLLQRVFAQEQEIQQLQLNVEKLAQLKRILQDMKKGYQVVSSGYSSIKSLSEGNFNLHQTYLSGLLQISPAVRQYKRVGDIIRYQVVLVKEYKQTYNRFKQDDNFQAQEMAYISRVYQNLFQQSLHNLDELSAVLTANQLRMTDGERLQAIDAIYEEMLDKLLFLRHLNQQTTLLAVQRMRAQKEVTALREIYGITN